MAASLRGPARGTNWQLFLHFYVLTQLFLCFALAVNCLAFIEWGEYSDKGGGNLASLNSVLSLGI